MDPKDIPPPHGKIECLGDFVGPQVIIIVGHGGDCATFHLAETYLHPMGPRWRALQGRRASEISRGLFGGLFSGIFGRKFGGVFRGPFTDTPGFDKNPRILNLKGDYPDAIRILLQIGTHEYPKLPKKLDFPDLVRLAEAAARWDSHALLAPFINEWVAPWRAMMYNPRYEQWLYVAHEFGWEDEYLKLSRHLATHCSVDAQDRLLALDGTVLEHRGKFPFDTLLHIHEGRRQILHSVIKALYDMWSAVASGNNCQLDGITEQEFLSCAGVNLLEFTSYLRHKALFPFIKTVEPIRYSAYDLARHVDGELLMHTSQLNSEVLRLADPTTTHINCPVGYKLGPVMQKILDDARWPVEPSIMEHIRSNTLKMGKATIHIDMSPKRILDKSALEGRRWRGGLFAKVPEVSSALDTDTDSTCMPSNDSAPGMDPDEGDVVDVYSALGTNPYTGHVPDIESAPGTDTRDMPDFDSAFAPNPYTGDVIDIDSVPGTDADTRGVFDIDSPPASNANIRDV